jgi:endonuclease/exonuclease/phosphatase family metal-dependent hydrolase
MLSLASPAATAGQGPALSDDDTVRVMIYNIKHGEGMDGTVDLSRSAEVIRRLNPDVVLLQEIDHRTERVKGMDQAARMSELSGLPHHAFGSFMEYQGGRYGMSLLSRWTVRSPMNHRLPEGAEPRSALSARIPIGGDGEEVTFVGIHLYRTLEERYAQAERLVDLFAYDTAPVVLAGDFNSRPQSKVIQMLDRYWTIPGKGTDHLTFPSDDPSVEIDYIMYRPSDAFDVVDHRVIDEPVASDHQPVILDLIVR